VKPPLRILTIDLEDWFHILDHGATQYPHQWETFPSRVEQNTERLLELLDRHRQRATFFCLGWIAERHPELVRKISRYHDIACHTYAHQLAYLQSPAAFREDTLKAKHVLEDIIGRKVTAFRAAGFSFTRTIPWAFEELIRCGFTADSSVFTGRRGHGGYPGFPENAPCVIQTPSGPITEFPLSTGDWAGWRIAYSGGGYFRSFPYGLIRSMIERTDYTMTYFHPRDIDADQPVLRSLPLMRRFKSYFGLSGCARKMEQLLSEFSFLDVETAHGRLDIKSLPEVQVPAVPTR
jgi:polysaccharide deacetylase family protein (PEP-CTERM system associated)